MLPKFSLKSWKIEGQRVTGTTFVPMLFYDTLKHFSVIVISMLVMRKRASRLKFGVQQRACWVMHEKFNWMLKLIQYKKYI